MKWLYFVVLLSSAVLCGCFPEGEDRDKWIDTTNQANLMQGPAGAETQDQSAPAGPAANAANLGSVNSAFPSTVPPGTTSAKNPGPAGVVNLAGDVPAPTTGE